MRKLYPYSTLICSPAIPSSQTPLLWSFYEYSHVTPSLLRGQDLMRVIPLMHLDTVLGHNLDQHPLEVDWHPPLQLVGAQSEDGKAFL